MAKNGTSAKIIFPIWVWIVVAVVIIGAAAFFFATGNMGSKTTLAKEISPAQVSRLQKDGALILDVREPDEWNAGHISGATLIPLGDLSNKLNDIPRDKQIVVVCRTGSRSATGRDILLNAGFPRVTSMGGGMTQWTAAGFPVIAGP
ncbi:MAG TPA: rhodanese-like domain-containing protein [Leptolinea sp.]